MAEPKIRKDRQYVGIVDDNDSEGEIFGYYFLAMPDSIAAIKQMHEIAEKYPEACEGWEFIHQSFDGDELAVLKKHDRNGYMSRVNICDGSHINWPELIEEFRKDLKAGNGVVFYKGNLLKKED